MTRKPTLPADVPATKTQGNAPRRLSLKPKADTPTPADNATQSRARNRKRIIRRDDLPAAKLSSTKPPPKPKPKKKPRPAPKAPTTPPSDIRAENLNASLSGFPIWLEFRPLAIGIERIVFQHIAKHSLSASKRVVQKLLHQHTRDRRYLAAVAAGGQRYNLDGTEAGEIMQAEQEHAARMLRANNGGA